MHRPTTGAPPNLSTPVLRVGLTGSIACGKSHVLARLASAGLSVLDLDEIAHRVLAAGGAAHDAVLREFGAQILSADGSIDRPALAAIIFSDEGARLRLNALVHPCIRAEEERAVEGSKTTQGQIVVSDGALLIEGGSHLRYARLIVVHCAPEIQLARLMQRDGFDRETALRRISAQMPMAEKRRFASSEIDTSGTYQRTNEQVAVIVESLREQAMRGGSGVRVTLAQAAACLRQGCLGRPAGLDLRVVLEEAALSGVIDFQALGKRMTPPWAGPWYHAAEHLPRGGIGPTSLTPTVLLWLLGQGVVDRERAVAASASLARLTHRDADSIAGACFYGEALFEAAVSRTLADSGSWECWRREAKKWGDGTPPAEVVRSIRCAQERRADLEAEDPQTKWLAACLLAMQSLASIASDDDDMRDLARRLGFRD